MDTSASAQATVDRTYVPCQGRRKNQSAPSESRALLVRFPGLLKTVCIYAGSMEGARPEYRAGAAQFARLLASDGIGVVYGGGRAGLMGAVADAAREAGGRVTGVIPRQLVDREVAHQDLDDLRVVSSMHERKALMAELADAFVAIPGGIGTLEELVEVFTWAQLGMHRKPVALLDLGGYYRGLVSFFDHATAEGFLRPATREMLLVEDDPATMIERLRAYEPPHVAQWIDQRGT
jgi:uncharacterized protein (TIGR00730 family)